MLGRRAIFLGLLAALVIGNAWGELKRQPSRTQEPVQIPSGQSAQPSASDQRGTDQMPFTVKILPSEDPKEKAEKEQSERREKEEKAAVDKRLADDTKRLAEETQNVADYTLWLAGFTLLLFFAAEGQIVVFVVQLRYIRDTVTLTKKATDTAEKTILTTETAYVFAGIGGSTIVRQQPTVAVTLCASAINYGQTPGMVSDIEWGLCPERELPGIGEPLDYPNNIFVGWTIRPRGWQQEQRPIVSVFGFTETHVFYGRVKYKDIFDRGPFFSEFMHTINTAGRMEPVEGRDAYARSRKPN